VIAVIISLLFFAGCANQGRQYTLEELGETIAAAGEFWNDWWDRREAFAWEHIDDSRRNWQPWYEEITPAHHPLSRGYSILLPSSGFTSLNDIGVHLLQFYTQSWVDREQFRESRVSMHIADGSYHYIFGVTSAFEEYDGYLFIFTANEWQPRPNWATAAHTLIEQDGSRAVVETVVSVGEGIREGNASPTITYRFTFMDGRIDSGIGQWNWPLEEEEEPQAYDVHEPRAERPRHHTNHILNIAPVTDALLATFERIHEFDYSQLRGGFYGGERIAIWTYQPVYDFEVVNIGNDTADNDLVFYRISTHGTIDTLVPGHVFVINNYIGVGTLPHSAVAFTDLDGMRFYFAIASDESDSPYAFVLWAIGLFSE